MHGEHGMAKFSAMQLHKSFGFTILGLALLRLTWRLAHRPPSFPETMKGWEKSAAHVVHWGFYFIILVMPLAGWIMVSASPTNIPTLLYKTLPMPHIGFIHALPMDARKTTEDLAGLAHFLLAWLVMLLIVLHLGAVLKHQFWDKDGVLYRMSPFRRPSTSA
jgi:cytochrome b561